MPTAVHPHNPEADAQQASESIPPAVVMVSGCKDSQTSADVQDVAGFQLTDEAGPGGAGGACTTSLVSTLEDESCPKPLPWGELLTRMRKVLKDKRYTQIPQLSSSRQMTLDQPFDPLQGSDPKRARALLIGINYVGQQGELRGCHNDVEMAKRMLLRMGFLGENMRLMMDDGSHETPTHANIVQGFAWLREGAAAGDARFMHYSGHGGSTRDSSGDEEDGKDETLIPTDFQQAGMIKDDEVSEHLIMRMAKDVKLTCIMDCCHSGTILDLPYNLKLDGETAEAVESGQLHDLMVNPNFNMEKAMQLARIAFEEFQNMDKKDTGGCLRCLMRVVQAAQR